MIDLGNGLVVTKQFGKVVMLRNGQYIRDVEMNYLEGDLVRKIIELQETLKQYENC